MTLKDCTKAELLQILTQVSSVESAAWIVECALSGIELARDFRRLDTADAINAHIKELTQQYAALLRPYNGKSIGEVPLPILEQARDLMHEIDKANDEWARLMGLDKHPKGE